MHRTQISLEEQQYHHLKRYAKESQQSISAVIRGLLDRYIDQAEDDLPDNPLTRLKGIVSGDGTAIGREHNQHLYQRNESREQE